MSNKQAFRILVEILAGIGLSVITNVIAISLGYKQFYSSGLESYQVKFLGIDIFNIESVNGPIVGTPVIPKMIIIGFIFSLVLMVVAEFIINAKKKKKWWCNGGEW